MSHSFAVWVGREGVTGDEYHHYGGSSPSLSNERGLLEIGIICGVFLYSVVLLKVLLIVIMPAVRS